MKRKRRKRTADSTDGLLGRRELAKKLGVTPRRISVWAADGMPVARGGGRGKESRYDLAAVLAWRAERRAADPSNTSLSQARAELAQSQRRKTELEIRRREGQLLERADVERIWGRHIADARTIALAMPRAYAERCVQAAIAGGAAAVERVLAEAVNGVLEELAST